MTSMEQFGPVSVDYFNERRVEDVQPGDGGEGSPVWSIFYAGGGILHNFDPTLPMPKAIKGAQQSIVILGAKREGHPVTEVRFGLEPVFLNPLEYAIIDPIYTRGELVYAQRSEANMPSTPPHPDERVQDGPDQEWQDFEGDVTNGE